MTPEMIFAWFPVAIMTCHWLYNFLGIFYGLFKARCANDYRIAQQWVLYTEAHLWSLMINSLLLGLVLSIVIDKITKVS